MENSKQFTEELEKENFKKWLKTEKLNKYMENHFTDYKIFKNDHVEIFIQDDELDSYWEENLGLVELYYIVDYFLQSKGIDLEGEPLSWFSDSISETILSVYPMSNLVFQEKEVF